MRETFNFVILLSFFSVSKTQLENSSVYASNTHTKRLLLPGIFLFWFWAAVYELQLESFGLKTVSKDASHTLSPTSGASVQLF